MDIRINESRDAGSSEEWARQASPTNSGGKPPHSINCARWPRKSLGRSGMKHLGREQRILMSERCAMDQPRPPRHHSFVGPIILIVLGAVLLMWRLYPEFSPWLVLFRYWPVILILIGLGQIWDSYYIRHHSPDAPRPRMSGVGI